MHDDRRIVEARISRFADKRLPSAVYQAYAPVTVTAWTAPDEPVPFAEAVKQKFEPIDIGTLWEGSEVTPEDASGSTWVWLLAVPLATAALLGTSLHTILVSRGDS